MTVTIVSAKQFVYRLANDNNFAIIWPQVTDRMSSGGLSKKRENNSIGAMFAL